MKGKGTNGSLWQGEPTRSDETGVFRVPAQAFWDRVLPARVAGRWGGLELTQSTPDQPWSGKAVVGDFVFPRAIWLTITVEDEEGQPIPKARIGVRGQNTGPRSTGGNGTTYIDLAPGSLVTLEVAALGYEFQIIQLRSDEKHANLGIRMARASFRDAPRSISPFGFPPA